MNNIDFPGEFWKPIIGLEEEYSLSNYGRVKSNERKDASGKMRKMKILKPLVTKGYTHYLLATGTDSRKKLCFSPKKEIKKYFSEEEIKLCVPGN